MRTIACKGVGGLILAIFVRMCYADDPVLLSFCLLFCVPLGDFTVIVQIAPVFNHFENRF